MRIPGRCSTAMAWAVALLVVLLGASSSWAQTFRGSILGTVTDTTGAAVSGASASRNDLP